MSLNLKAFITGASSGIGQSMVAAYLAAVMWSRALTAPRPFSLMNLTTLTTSWILPTPRAWMVCLKRQSTPAVTTF
ncbi:hypothetical protein [Rahnella sp. PCH160]|uniref:hypothetical protein n=1 Tax=Rahnella sp. PCH160 TaxID=3447928 RepID=UPI0039FD5B80